MRVEDLRVDLADLIKEVRDFHQQPNGFSGKSAQQLVQEHDVRVASISQKIGRLRIFLYRFRSQNSWIITASAYVWDALDHLTLSDIRDGHSATMFASLGNQVLGELSLLPDDHEIPPDPRLPIGPSPAGLLGDIHAYLPHLVPELEKAVVLYRDRHFDESVQAAWFSLRDALRQRTGSTEDGTDLVNAAFGKKTPLIVIGDPDTESGRNEQEGLASLFRGFATGIRNPAIHESRQEEPQRAFEYLVTASLLQRRLAECRATSENPIGAN